MRTHFSLGDMAASERREKVVLGQRHERPTYILKSSGLRDHWSFQENLCSRKVEVSSQGQSWPLGTKQDSF